MTVTVDLTDLHPAAQATWSAIANLAANTDTETWVVVGGQMVAIHATVAGVAVPRATDDGDIVVDVRTHSRDAMRRVTEALSNAGFGADLSPDGIVRFVKGDAKIDLLAPEGLGSHPVDTGKGRTVQAPGSTQAIERAGHFRIQLADEQSTIRVPNLLGAIIAKSAAATEIISATRIDKEKHERDLATLLMCAAQDPDLDQMATAMTKKDRQRLKSASHAFDDPTHPCWTDGANRSDLNTAVSLLLS